MSLFLDTNLENYLNHFALQTDQNLTLREMEKYAFEHQFPIIGPQVGQLLYFLAKLSNATRVFEFGSGYGYSAYWFCKALPTDGLVVCTECSPENKSHAEECFTKLGITQKVQYHLQLGQKIIGEYPEPFDIIFNDVNKEEYPEVFQLSISHLKSGGLYIADNALWAGRVASTVKAGDEKAASTIAVQQHNELVFAHPQFDAVLLPIRDGVLVARKK